MSAIHDKRPIHPNSIWPHLSEDIICPLCDKTFRQRGYRRHLNLCLEKNHMTVNQYMKKFPGVLFRPFHSLVHKLRDLIKMDDYNFGWQCPRADGGRGAFLCHPFMWEDEEDNEWAYLTYDTFKPKHYYYRASPKNGQRYKIAEAYPLNRGLYGYKAGNKIYEHFRIHLQGRGTLAIRATEGNSFVAIDIDTNDIRVAQNTCNDMRSIGLHPYVFSSGRKGFHVYAFFSKTWSRCYQVGMGDLIERTTRQEVDRIYPFCRSILKLPFGVHQATGKFCGLVDESTGELLEPHEQIAFFDNVVRTDVPDVCNQGNMLATKHEEPETKTETHQKSKPRLGIPDIRELVSCLDEGKKLCRGRHRTLYWLAIHMKDDKRAEKQQARQVLQDWSRKVQSSRCLEWRLRDVDETVEKVYSKNLHRKLPYAELNEGETQVLSELCSHYLSPEYYYGASGKGRRCDRSRVKRVFFSISKALAEMAKCSPEGFAVGTRDLAKRANCSRRTLTKYLPVVVGDTDGDHLFVRKSKGGLVDFKKSEYKISTSLAKKLGW